MFFNILTSSRGGEDASPDIVCGVGDGGSKGKVVMARGGGLLVVLLADGGDDWWWCCGGGWWWWFLLVGVER